MEFGWDIFNEYPVRFNYITAMNHDLLLANWLKVALGAEHSLEGI